MDTPEVIRTFYNHFEKMNLEGVLSLFTPRAVINSPTLGKKEASVFYRDLFAQSKQIKVSINDIFVNPEKPNRAAAFTHFRWKTKQGEDIEFDCIVIFQTNPQGKIEQVQAIYDAQAAREALRKAG